MKNELENTKHPVFHFSVHISHYIYFEITLLREQVPVFHLRVYPNDKHLLIQEFTILLELNMIEFDDCFSFLVSSIEQAAKKHHLDSISYYHGMDVFVLNNYEILNVLSQAMIRESGYIMKHNRSDLKNGFGSSLIYYTKGIKNIC